jgi:hypothetical protein
MTSIDDPGTQERITGLQDDDIRTEREPRASTMDDEDGTDPDAADGDDDGTDGGDGDDDGTDTGGDKADA